MLGDASSARREEGAYREYATDEQRSDAPQIPVFPTESNLFGALGWLVPLGLASLVGYTLLALQPGSWRDQPLLFAGLGVTLGALYLLALMVVRRREESAPQRRGTLTWILAVAVLMRLIALPLAPSDDVNRYVTEGTQLRAGENPYLVAPDRSNALTALPDELRAGVNHRDWPAIYPPATLLFEGVITSFSVRPLAFKVAALLLELAGLVAVLLLLLRLRRSPCWIIAAAWNPVGPLFGAGEGHHDFMLAALLALSLLVSSHRKVGLGLVAVALAALTKPFALVAIPAQSRLRDPRTWLIPALIALIAYLPFASAGAGLFQSLGRFGSELHFHGVLEPWVRWLCAALVPEAVVQGVTVSILAAIWVVASVAIWRRARTEASAPATLTCPWAWPTALDGNAHGLAVVSVAPHGTSRPPPARSASLRDRLRSEVATCRVLLTVRLFAVLLICLPTLHPWYLAPLVMLLPFVRSWALVAWTAMAPLYWLHGLALASGVWHEVAWVTLLAHGPALAWLGWEVVSGPLRRAPQARPLAMEAQSS